MEYENNTGFPSVTTILEPFVDKRWFKKIHRDRGSAVHAAVSSNLKGLFVPSLPPAWQPYYDSFLPFREHIVEVILVEERITDEDQGYTGQIDLIALMDDHYNNMTALIDWKTSQAMYRTFPVQLGGYCGLSQRVKKIVPDIGICCRLRKDPGKKMLTNIYDYDTLVYMMNSFTAARRCYKDLIE